LTALFGGHHQSAPRFSSFGVQPCDRLIPVCLRKGVLYLVACMRVERLIPVPTYLEGRLGLPGEKAARWGWDLEDELWATRPADQHLLPGGCVDEAAVGEGVAPIRFDRRVSPGLLSRIRFENRKGEQRGLKHVMDGRLTHPATLHGRVYRLSRETAREFARVLSDRNRPPVPVPDRVAVPKRSFYLPRGQKMELVRRGRITGVMRHGSSAAPAGYPWQADIRVLRSPDGEWYSIGWDVRLEGQRDYFYGTGGSPLTVGAAEVPPGADPADWMAERAVEKLKRVRCVLVEYGCSFLVSGWEWEPPEAWSSDPAEPHYEPSHLRKNTSDENA
jgi:hypothetical protein